MLAKVLSYLNLRRVFSVLGLILIGVVATTATEHEIIYGERDISRTISDIITGKKYTEIPQEVILNFSNTVTAQDGFIWKRKKPIKYYLLAEDAEYIKYAKMHFKLAELFTGISMTSTDDPMDADFSIAFGVHDVTLSEGENEDSAVIFNKSKCKIVLFLENEEVQDIGFIIRSNAGIKDVEDCFWTLFYRGFGILGTSGRDQSVFSGDDGTQHTFLPQQDHLTIRMLYSQYIESGTKRDTLSDVLPDRLFLETIHKSQIDNLMKHAN